MNKKILLTLKFLFFYFASSGIFYVIVKITSIYSDYNPILNMTAITCINGLALYEGLRHSILYLPSTQLNKHLWLLVFFIIVIILSIILLLLFKVSITAIIWTAIIIFLEFLLAYILIIKHKETEH